MKTSPFVVVLLAAGSSVATVAILDFLREPPTDVAERPTRTVSPSPARPAPETSTPQAADSAVVPPVELAPPEDLETRLAEIERRIGALELGATSARAPVAAEGSPPSQDDLRELVLDWVAEDRLARSRARALEAEEDARKESEFNARYQALMLAQEHDLEDWHRDKFADIFLLADDRRREIEAEIDPLTQNPEEVEAIWLEFDEWIEKLEREVTALDPELYAKIYGED